ncbi:MAG TPA: hypothetical protein VIK71_06560 [Flavobacteriales bacterium]
MKYLYIAACTLLFSACNDNKSATPSQPNAPQETNVATPLPVEEDIPQAFFSASGNDWTLDVKSAMNGTFPMTLIQNNGKDTIKTVLNKSMTGNEKPAPGKSTTNYIGVVEGADKGEVIELNIFPGQCTAADGTKTNFSCKISIGKKNLIGCGNYSED